MQVGRQIMTVTGGREEDQLGKTFFFFKILSNFLRLNLWVVKNLTLDIAYIVINKYILLNKKKIINIPITGPI